MTAATTTTSSTPLVFAVAAMAAAVVVATSTCCCVTAFSVSGVGTAYYHRAIASHPKNEMTTMTIATASSSIASTTSLVRAAYREQSPKSRGNTRTNRNEDSERSYNDAFFEDFDDDRDFDNQNKLPITTSQQFALTQPSSTFYSKKPLTDPTFSISSTSNNSNNNNNSSFDNKQQQQFFQLLCQCAQITRPSRIQSLAWPILLRGTNTIVADQTGSGKTLAYLLPLLQMIRQDDDDVMGRRDASSSTTTTTTTQWKKKRMGSPRILILTPTAELADQIHTVCSSLSKKLSSSSSSSTTTWSFNPFVTTATGSHSTNIRDQIRLLQSSPIDVLISTPGRLATILRTKNAGLDLGHVRSVVLDEVDFLLVDETFGPQLRTVGVAVQGGSGGDGSSGDDEEEEDDSDKRQSSSSSSSSSSNNNSGPQFIFVTATLPEDVLQSIQSEFPNVTQLRGPGLHRTSPSIHPSLIDVSVPASSNRDQRACFDIKIREMFKALRSRRCDKTLIFCNTVETCRNVENALKRKDKRMRRNKVWAYHNALSPEVRLKNLHSFSTAATGGGGEDNDDDGLECILVCTDRAARGIDFDASPIDHVLLFDFPKDPAEYVRRVGRTARAGREGASTVLAYGWQLPIARKIMGLSGGGRGGGKDGKGKKTAKLDAFTMMKSSDGWEEQDAEDEYYMKGGAKRRMEIASKGGGGGSGIVSSPRKQKKDGKGPIRK